MNILKINIKNLFKKYDDKVILNNINMRIYDGEIVSIIGKSGCGKTTIFNCISNLIDYDGEIDINTKKGISYMQQKDLLLPFYNIINNVSLPLILEGKKKESAYKEVSKYFSLFSLEGYENKYPYELSGGMKQRASLFRAYISKKDIMLLDEPFSALDEFTRYKLYDWYLEFHKKLNITTLLITHNIDEAIYLSNRIYILEDGRIKKEIKIDMDYKRNIVDNKFIEYKKEILSILT